AHFAQRRSLPNCVAIQGQQYGLKDSVVQAEMITNLLKSDLVDVDKGSIAMLTGETMRELIHAVGFVIQADCEPV
ncbi:MAG: hypothetical protein Q7R41_20605, partial [Phycisphaerales bacterium]|nr:hypothetical protein [Phycisphaerales bacterium]